MANIVITGSSRGIGMATALLLARVGHSVIATMGDPARSPELGRISAAESLRVQIEGMDVDSDASVQACFAKIQSRAPVDVLLNNAGIERMGSIEESPPADFRACMETNYIGALRCIQAVVPGMRERRQGSIVNVTSVAGRICAAPMTAYAASKFALEAASEGLAQEMKPFGVRVVIVEPGIIDTRDGPGSRGAARVRPLSTSKTHCGAVRGHARGSGLARGGGQQDAGNRGKR